MPPLNYQRVRYEKELKEEALRYIDVFNDGILTLLVDKSYFFHSFNVYDVFFFCRIVNQYAPC